MTKLEEVAKAIDPECFDPEVERVYGDMWAFERQRKAREAAIAAVKAMRKPSRLMLDAASKSMSPGRRPTPERVSVRAKHGIRYRAMIDQILSEKEKGK